MFASQFLSSKQVFISILRQIKSGAQTGQKTFNATYIKFILGSSLFRSNCK
jgi:hypothetical protein